MPMVSFARQRDRMVRKQLAARGVRDERVLEAMRTVPRERFVSRSMRAFVYRDGPLPIEAGQTISQPFVVASMLEALEIDESARVLEVGAGSGYAAAVVSLIAREVYAIERHAVLVHEAAERLARLGYANVHLRHGDGMLGWPEEAPFDDILVSAGGPAIPPALLEQLAPGGRLVIPVGPDHGSQQLVRVRRSLDGEYTTQTLGPVRFVPLVEGAA